MKHPRRYPRRHRPRRTRNKSVTTAPARLAGTSGRITPEEAAEVVNRIATITDALGACGASAMLQPGQLGVLVPDPDAGNVHLQHLAWEALDAGRKVLYVHLAPSDPSDLHARIAQAISVQGGGHPDARRATEADKRRIGARLMETMDNLKVADLDKCRREAAAAGVDPDRPGLRCTAAFAQAAIRGCRSWGFDPDIALVDSFPLMLLDRFAPGGAEARVKELEALPDSDQQDALTSLYGQLCRVATEERIPMWTLTPRCQPGPLPYLHIHEVYAWWRACHRVVVPLRGPFSAAVLEQIRDAERELGPPPDPAAPALPVN